MVPLFAALLSVSVPEGRYPRLDLTPQQQKQQTYDALAAWLVEESERQAVLAVWEDLQWADPSTLEVLGLVIDQTPTVRMLTVLTSRPDFTPPWPTRSHLTPLTLNRLERPQVEALVQHLAGGKALPAEVLQQIVSKTDGVPLFVEELTKMVLESTLLRPVNGHYELSGPLPPLAIPATLQDSLMARLDRLSEVREVVQLGAVLGREFAYESLRMLMTLDDATLQARLGRLVAAELLYQRGRPPRARYVFKHALIQDVAYGSMLKSTRQRAHQQIAQVFARHFPEIVETQPEVVAYHYTEAGLIEQALPYWQKAGERAIERSANVEAISHLTKGLEVLQTLPDTPERSQHELALQITLGTPLIAPKAIPGRR
jgi:predicted ATPase